jgi:hypothetical protein
MTIHVVANALLHYPDPSVPPQKSERGRVQVYPPSSSRPCPPEVPEHVRAEFNEACAILASSPRGSAAMSRRCLQTVLREAGGAKPSDLSSEIDEILDREVLASHLAEILDAIRHIGNFGTHPIKSKSTGEVLPVEPGEAEWNLEVLEGLFDFYYVQPVRTAARKAALNEKLKDAGKPELP